MQLVAPGDHDIHLPDRAIRRPGRIVEGGDDVHVDLRLGQGLRKLAVGRLLEPAAGEVGESLLRRDGHGPVLNLDIAHGREIRVEALPELADGVPERPVESQDRRTCGLVHERQIA